MDFLSLEPVFVVTEGLLWKAKKVKLKASKPLAVEVMRGRRQEGAYGIPGGSCSPREIKKQGRAF
jgi:hypothetical protein